MNGGMTLAQAIDAALLYVSGEGQQRALADLQRARQKLDGLEESRAVVETRARAFERAMELAVRRDPGASHQTVMEIAVFLAPVWDDLEREAIDERVAELEASEASATARADGLEDERDQARQMLHELRERIQALVPPGQDATPWLRALERIRVELPGDRDLVFLDGEPFTVSRKVADEWRRMQTEIARVQTG